MKIKKVLLLLGCMALASSAFAQESTTQRSETEEKVVEKDYRVGVTNFAVRPTAGAIFFNGQQRFTGGVLMDFNVLGTPWAKIGPAFGALYSSTGGGGDFFDGIATSNNSYFFQIPANLKATFSPDPQKRLQLGAHGGANIIRSSGTQVALGGAFGAGPSTTNLGTSASSGSSWDVHPNVGADVDFALGTNVDLTLRPDVTFLSDFNMVTATLGLALKL